MGSQLPQPAGRRPWVEVLDEREDYRFGGLFCIVLATLRYRRFDGEMSAQVQRINFERGDSVGVLLFDPKAEAVVLVRQFRYPVYAGLEPEARTGAGAQRAWLLEIVAGMQDSGRTVREVAHRELLEEAGYGLQGSLQPIATIYASPGGTSERIHIFLAEVKGGSPVGPGGGSASEGEDTQVVVLPLLEAMAMVARGEIQDAKTVVALQHLALQRALGQEMAGA